MPRDRTLAAALTAALLAAPAAAPAQEDALVSFEVLGPGLALELAEATMEACREQGYQVAVAVVDRFGQTQVVLRDRFAGPHTVGTSQAKAWTAVSFRTPTLELEKMIMDGELPHTLREVPGALMLGGGLPVEAAGTMVGGVGVSGAPSPDLDEDCAAQGIETISGQLPF